MKPRDIYCRLLAVISLTLIAAVADAHHSQSYFSKEYSELKGEITKIEWRNPHVRFELLSVDSSGVKAEHRLETNSIYYLERAGVKKGRIKVGDQVQVGGYASVKAGGDFLTASMLLPDGENLEFIRDAVTLRFSDEVQNTVDENKGLFRVWSIPQVNKREMSSSLTEAAKVKKAEFDLLDNFTTTCESSGMPRLMWYPHPYEFVNQLDSRKILLRTEMYDLTRTIHIDPTLSAAPENTPYSKLGYSVGAWRQGTLVVKTSHINWEYYDTTGVPQSNAIEVVEEFTLSEDQSRLDFFITSTDPETFTEPATVKAYWLALGEEIKPYNCEVY